jgi:hypothetical protein
MVGAIVGIVVIVGGAAVMVGMADIVGLADIDMPGMGTGVTGGAGGAMKCPSAHSTPLVRPAGPVKKPTRSPASLTPLMVVRPRPPGAVMLRNPARRVQVNPNDLALSPLPVM